MKYSQNLIQTKKGIKRLDVAKRPAHHVNKKKSSQHMMSSVSSEESLAKKEYEIEFFAMTISEINCALRIKMKELTFNVTCNPMFDVREPHINMKIKIKRMDTDLALEDARVYIRKLVILVNKHRVPMLFLAIDFSRFPKAHCWHVIYKLKQDEKCPFVALRILSNKSEFAKRAVTI